MTASATLDGKTLNVNRLVESVDAVAVHKDAWENETYKRKVTVYGVVQAWTIDCYERGVTWANSVYKHLKGLVKSGDPVNLTISLEGEELVNTNVCVLKVSKTYLKGQGSGQKYRKFTVLLQEA